MGNSASALPYSIGASVAAVNDGWTLHDGKRKSDGAAVSAFVAKKPSLSRNPLFSGGGSPLTQLAPAVHHYTYSKRLRHPHILQVLATLDTDHPTDATAAATATASTTGTAAAASLSSSSSAASSSDDATLPAAASKEPGDLIIVTEPCLPLETWLQQTRPSPDQLAWGLESVVRALHFLHASANLAHGLVVPSSLYVTPSGDVKVWNFALVTPVTPDSGPSWHFREHESALTPSAYRSPERMEGRWKDIGANGVHTMDAYALGMLIPTLFGGTTPALLQKAVQRLLTPNLKMRPRLQPLLKCPIFQTPYQQLQLQLEELAIQPVEQKIAFWQHLATQLPNQQSVPPSTALHKVLPLVQTSIHTIADSESLRGQDLYRRELLALVQPFFYILETYCCTPSDPKSFVAPNHVETIASLFRVNDRGIRGTMLQKMAFLSRSVDANALNTSVFEPLCSGFADSSAALRELTLKSTLSLVPHLTAPNVEKLSRYLVRLQNDTEPSIRTNTVIFFTKLAPHLSSVSRQKMLLPAFVRALKDPFTPCRLAALQSVLQAKDFFDPPAIAASVLPAVTPQLLDPVPEVRKEAFRLVDDLLFLLRQVSERMPAPPASLDSGGSSHAPAPSSGPAPAIPSAPSTGPSSHAPAPASGGYLSSLSSWVTSSAKPTTSSASVPVPNPPAPPAAVSVRAAPLPPAATPNVAAMHIHSTPNNNADFDLDVDDAGDDGWGDDDVGDDELTGHSSRSGSHRSAAAAPSSSAALPVAAKGGLLAPAQEDDFFGTFDTAKTARPRPAATSAAGGRGRGKLVIPGGRSVSATGTPTATKPPKPAVTKLTLDDDPVGDAWDDF